MGMTAVRRLIPATLAAGIGFLALAGCSSGGGEPIALPRSDMAAAGNAERLPLSMPPNYALRPGQQTDLVRRPATQAAPPPPASGQQALLQAAGAQSADPRIRERLSAGPGQAVVPEDDLGRLIAMPSGSRGGFTRTERLSVEPILPR